MIQPIPKPTKVLKEPKPLQRKTPMRTSKVMHTPKLVVDTDGKLMRGVKWERKTLDTLYPKNKEPDGMTLDALRWQATRICWFVENPPDYDGDYYQCRLCPFAVHKDETTLDHIWPRSTHPKRKFKLSNLQPAHAVCNSRKGSMSMPKYEKLYGVGGIKLAVVA